MENLVEYSRETIQKGSKSFALASFFFSKEQRQGAWMLYTWCRYVDDQIDKANSRHEALARLNELELQTRNAYEGSFEPTDPAFKSLSIVARTHQVPMKYPLDMLRGMRMDVEGKQYESLAELKDYCYCVAGTVGLMMCHIMKLSDEVALKHAVDLGNAMQMTNITRDVKEDWELGRIYFPKPWLVNAGIDPKHFGDPIFRKKWVQLCNQLLREADLCYQSGWAGLRYLPWRAAWAVAIAAQVYSRIGHKVGKRADSAWNERCFVTLKEKIWILVKTTVRLTPFLGDRIFKPWKPQPIQMTWSE